MVFDYVTLKFIWWLFICILLIGFAITGGIDLGVSALMPFISKRDDHRRIIINAIGPTWYGNQVWLVTAGAAIFAAWPFMYAAAFSGLYIALFITLLVLILKPVSIDYRSKLESPMWRTTWDWGIFASGAVPAVVFGVGVGNLFQGLPFYYDDNLRVYYVGSFFHLLKPFPLVVGIVSASMLFVHGAIFLQIKTSYPIAGKCYKAMQFFAGLFCFSFLVAGFWIIWGLKGMQVINIPDLNTSFSPLRKIVSLKQGAWLNNFMLYKALWLFPVISFFSMIKSVMLAGKNHLWQAFICSSICVTCVIFTASISLFPFIFPSISTPNHSLTIWDASSSHKTLQMMFWVVMIFLPIVIAYTSWVYKVMSGKVSKEKILNAPEAYY